MTNALEEYNRQTKMAAKYVLTGGPGVGKSSIILALEQKGYTVVREAAEDWIKLQQAKGIKEPWFKPDFQDQILKLQKAREYKTRKARNKVFIDRGTLDGLAYYQKDGKEPSEMMKTEIQRLKRYKRYTKVFLIENLGSCETNEVRRENLEEAIKLEKLQEQNYKQLGYEVIRIPSGRVEKRVELIEVVLE